MTYEKGTIDSRRVRGDKRGSIREGDGNELAGMAKESGCTGTQPQRSDREIGTIGIIESDGTTGGDSTGDRSSLRIRITPVTHGKTIGLLIGKSERRKQFLRKEIQLLQDQIALRHSELSEEDRTLAELRANLASWQSNIDRLREIREGELNYPEGSE